MMGAAILAPEARPPTGGDLLPTVWGAYSGSDAAETQALYARLERLGPIGVVAATLFRAQKNSARAKVYRGGNGRGSYRRQAYGRKEWAIGELVTALGACAEAAGIRFGWGTDDVQPRHKHVLYVDLPTGQVSFHVAERGDGPDYPGEFDGVPGQSPDRILRWCARLLAGDGGRA